jgi:oxalate---CoA ligase
MSEPLTVADWLSRAAARWPDRPALSGVDDDRFLSHGELRELVMGQAARIRAAGVGRDDVALLSLPDGPMALATFLTVASIATVLPVAPHEQPDEYVRILDEIPVRAVVMEDRPHAPLTRLADERGLTLLRAMVRPGAPAATFALEVVRPAAPRPERAPTADDDALYVLTSGTTATPKIVAVSHRSLWRSMEGSLGAFRLSEDDRSLCLMPIVHLHSLIRCSLPVLATGGSVVWTPGFDDRRVPGWLERFAPTFISAAPAIHRKLLRAVDAAAWQPRPGLPRLFGTAADRLDLATLRGLEERFGAPVVQLYGLSETAPLIAATPLDGPPTPPGSTGRVDPAWSVVLVGGSGEPLGPGEPGEIAVSGGIVNRLVGRSAARVQRFDGSGRFLTGDLGRLDGDGFLYVDGRVDDVVNRGGQKLHLAAVEAAMASHPAVRAVAAFAVPDPVLGSRVAVGVEVHEGATVTADELLEHAGRSLRSYMVPERVFFTEALPRNEVGKLSRRDLAARFRAAPDEAATLPPPRAELLTAVLETYRRVLRRDDLDPETSFFDLGGDSLLSLYVLLELEDRLGVSVPPATFTRHSSASSLAAYLGRREPRVPPARLTVVQAGEREPHLIVAHGMDGQYNHVAATLTRLGLAPNVAIAALSSAGPQDLEAEPATLEDLAREYARLVREGLDGRYALVGYSLGAQIARAAAGMLVSEGAGVDLLAVIDDEAELDRRSFGAVTRSPAERTIPAFYGHLVSCSPPAPYPGRIVFIRNEEDDAYFRSDVTGGWGEVALGGVEAAVVPGNHHSIVEQERLPELARVLLDRLEAARARTDVPPAGPDAQRVVRYEARLACVRGDRAAEIARYREAIAMDPEQPSWVYENLASALFSAGDEEAGSRALDEALLRDPWPLSIAVRSAERWVSQGPRWRLEGALRASRAVSPDHPSVLCQRGELTMTAGLMDEAEALFRHGLAMAPAHFRLHRGLAELLRRQSRFVEAARVLAEANEQTPGLGWLIVLEAETLLEAGRPATALEVLDRAPRSLIDDAHRGPLVRGLAHEVLGRVDEAVASSGDGAGPGHRAALAGS